MHPSEEDPPPRTSGAVEPRWPVALAIGGFIAINVVLRVAEPETASLGPRWLVLGVEVAMLLTLLAADPARVMARTGTASAALARAGLSAGRRRPAVHRRPRSTISSVGGGDQAATALLASGALVWLGNSLIFGLLYWLLDSGGPVARFRGEREFPDFAFSQQLSPELAPAGWRPMYVDYFILGITTSTAFSPTE